MQIFRFFGLAAVLFGLQAQGLKVAASTMWIEHTPLVYTIKNLYKGDASLVNGGVTSLGSGVELGANAETQGLLNFPNHKNYRLIYIIVDVAYRLVCNKAAGINTLADLKGKKIGTIPSSSADVFVKTLLGSVGLSASDYTTVSGNVCMRAPCGAGTFPAQFKSKQIDAFGVWETSVELGIEALGAENVVVFQNETLYREAYSLFATAENLQNVATRKNIVQFVKALNQTLDIFRNDPDKVYSMVGQTVGVDIPVLKNVWPVHLWGPRSMGKDFLDYLVTEDEYLAKTNRRQAASRDDLAKFIDTSVYEDALKL